MAQSSDFSPRIVSHPPSSQVHCRLLLVNGICGSDANGDIQISAHQDNFPTQSFPVRNGQFKALIHLSPGENRIKMTFYHDGTPWVSYWPVHYVPLPQNPPLHLCIIIGSDSPCTYDDVPDCEEPPNLDTAIKKLRLAGYLWQAYTAAQMSSNGLGHRTFQLEESWQRDTLSVVDESDRNTATIRVLRSKYTTAEIRDPQRAQQNGNANNKNSLMDIALEAIRPEFPGDTNYIAALFLDSHFENGLITGHAALGMGNATAQYSLGIFGSHTLFAWPSSLERVIPCFMDETPVDTNYCGIDAEDNQYWLACNVGLGAMMHEVGHQFGCPHRENGVMMRDYIRLNRSFSVTEPPGPPALDGNECSWHRLDLLRFRAHPCYALPDDRICREDEVHVFGVEQGILIRSASKILSIEICDEIAKSWLDYAEKPLSEVILSEHELQSKVKIEVIALNGATASIADISELQHAQPVAGLGKVWKTAKLGWQTGTSSTALLPLDPVVNIRIYSDYCLYGLEFFTERNTILFGERGGTANDFPMEDGEFIRGFGVRSGAWIDALQIITNKKRSEWFGDVHGGSEHALMVPTDDHKCCGVYGEIDNHVMKIGLHYCILT